MKYHLTNRNGIYYLNFYSPVTGRYQRISLKTKSEDDAKKAADKKIAVYANFSEMISLGTLLQLYANPDTNPRFQRRKREGGSYSKRYAKYIARHAKYLDSIISKSLPKIYKMPLNDLKARQGLIIRDLLLNELGPCRTSQYIFRSFKAMFSEARQTAIIEINHMEGLPDIRYKEKQRDAVYPEYINLILQAKEYFDEKKQWAYLAILATTGMRRSEVLALNKEQLFNNNLTIDRALISNSADLIGPPKGGVIRIIPLAEITLEAINYIHPDKKGRFFPYGQYWVERTIKSMREIMIGLHPEYKEIWNGITAHVFRHSLNTNLKAMSINERKVDTYMSWEHQSLNEVADRYTHLKARQLIEVAEAIDIMCQGKIDYNFKIIDDSDNFLSKKFLV